MSQLLYRILFVIARHLVVPAPEQESGVAQRTGVVRQGRRVRTPTLVMGATTNGQTDGAMYRDYTRGHEMQESRSERNGPPTLQQSRRRPQARRTAAR